MDNTRDKNHNRTKQNADSQDVTTVTSTTVKITM